MPVRQQASGTTTLTINTDTTPSGLSAVAAPVTGGRFKLWVDLSNLANGETFTLTMQKTVKAASGVKTYAKRVLALGATGEPAQCSDEIELASGESLTVIMRQDSGTGRAYDWELLQIDWDPRIVHQGTAQAGAAGTVTLAAAASATDSLYRGMRVTVVNGTGAGQTRLISAYVGSTKVASVVPNWTTNPSTDSDCVVEPWAGVDVESWLNATAPAMTGDAYARIGANGAGLTAVPDTAGTTTLLSRLSSARAGFLDYLDAAISSRSTYAGADTAGTTTLLSRIAQAILFSASGNVKVDAKQVNGITLQGTGTAGDLFRPV